jgi:hypothetical protein
MMGSNFTLHESAHFRAESLVVRRKKVTVIHLTPTYRIAILIEPAADSVRAQERGETLIWEIR